MDKTRVCVNAVYVSGASAVMLWAGYQTGVLSGGPDYPSYLTLLAASFIALAGVLTVTKAME